MEDIDETVAGTGYVVADHLHRTVHDRDFLFGWMARGRLDSVPPCVPKFSPFRKHLCRRKYAGGDVQDGTGSIVASPDSLLLFGNTCRNRAGAGLHAIDRRLHSSDRGT